MVIHYTNIYNNVVFPGKKVCIFRFKGRKSCANGDSVTLEFNSSGRIPRSISTRGRAITNDWRISMAIAIVGNLVTSGSDQRPTYDQLLRPTTAHTINRGDRSYYQS